MPSEKKKLYFEVIRAVREGKAKNFRLDTRYKYPDFFFEIDMLRVGICTGSGKVGVQDTNAYNSFDNEHTHKIRGSSVRLRRALRKYYPKEYSEFFIKDKKTANFKSLMTRSEVEDVY